MTEISISSWLAQLADRTPTPGGGAAAALSAATSAALIGMVTAYTTGPKWADREARMQEMNAEVAEFRESALRLADDDATAFEKVGAAYRLPNDSDSDKSARRQAIQAALSGAAEPPRAIGRLAAQLVAMADELAATGNPNVISDVAVAAALARAALDAAIVNIEINAALIRDETVKELLAVAVGDFARAGTEADGVTRRVRELIGK